MFSTPVLSKQNPTSSYIIIVCFQDIHQVGHYLTALGAEAVLATVEPETYLQHEGLLAAASAISSLDESFNIPPRNDNSASASNKRVLNISDAILTKADKHIAYPRLRARLPIFKSFDEESLPPSMPDAHTLRIWEQFLERQGAEEQQRQRGSIRPKVYVNSAGSRSAARARHDEDMLQYELRQQQTSSVGSANTGHYAQVPADQSSFKRGGSEISRDEGYCDQVGKRHDSPENAERLVKRRKLSQATSQGNYMDSETDEDDDDDDDQYEDTDGEQGMDIRMKDRKKEWT